MLRDGPALYLLEADRNLGSVLPRDELEHARRAIRAPRLELPPGDWQPSGDLPGSDADLGVLVVQGLLARDVVLAQRTCTELLGPGDLLRPLDDIGSGGPVPARAVWHVVMPTTLALLDRDVIAQVSRWPELTSALVARAVGRAQTMAFAMAISSITGLRLRVLVLLWHLADRFGSVRADGVCIPLPLTQEMIGRLVGASRPSVSTAMKELERQGELARRPDGPGFLLLGAPPELDRRLAGRASAA